ncbi:MAG: hypothetical protein SCK29_12595 [Bacillota bacterium]|nr:hypothetical protein [Bacillota bacterium]MDW7684940.1 hypothetical protein [Bacillota bacterium]
MSDLQLLLTLQQTDLELDKLQKTLKGLPVFAEFKTLQSQAADAKEALGWAEGKLAEHGKRIRRMEMELRKVEQEHSEVNNTLYSSSEQSAKELELLERKKESLQREKDKQEEDMLEAMQGTEDLQNALNRANTEYVTVSKELRSLQKTGNEQINSLKDEIRRLRDKRDLLLQQIDRELLSEYKEKRKQYYGRPLALLEGDICSGCRVSVSSNTRSLLCRPNIKVLCENCGRILIPVLP